MRNPHLAELWREEMESFPVGEARIRDGHAYFIRGAVKDFTGHVGRLEAKVHGSRPEPYHVSIGVDLFAPESWQRILDWLEANDWDKSELENGRISLALSMQLENLQLHLVPRKYKDIRTDCNCPDWMRPCKHILAVCFAFALEIEHDPQVLLRLRGASLGDPATEQAEAPAEQLSESREELSLDPQQFWKPVASLDDLALQIGLPEETTLRRYWQRLGPLPFWGGNFDLSPMLRPLLEEVRLTRLRSALDTKADQKS